MGCLVREKDIMILEGDGRNRLSMQMAEMILHPTKMIAMAASIMAAYVFLLILITPFVVQRHIWSHIQITEKDFGLKKYPQKDPYLRIHILSPFVDIWTSSGSEMCGKSSDLCKSQKYFRSIYM